MTCLDQTVTEMELQAAEAAQDAAAEKAGNPVTEAANALQSAIEQANQALAKLQTIR